MGGASFAADLTCCGCGVRDSFSAGQSILTIRKCKRDDYAIWEAYQEQLRRLFQKMLPSTDFSLGGHVGGDCNLASGGGF